jgi:hypothetical protein
MLIAALIQFALKDPAHLAALLRGEPVFPAKLTGRSNRDDCRKEEHCFCSRYREAQINGKEASMAKGQVRSNKEARKPKKEKPKSIAANPSTKGSGKDSSR